MKYYKTWQEALQSFITNHGQEYKEVDEVYALTLEFEQQLFQNINGAYFMYTGESKCT